MKIKLTNSHAYDISDVIREMIDDSGISQRTLADKLGMKSQGSLSTTLKGNMTVSTLLKILDVMECDLVIKRGEKRYFVKNK